MSSRKLKLILLITNISVKPNVRLKRSGSELFQLTPITVPMTFNCTPSLAATSISKQDQSTNMFSFV
jgi:hypothetical protein